MPRRRGKDAVDRGRRFFETTSPFETYEPGGKPPKTFKGLVDDSSLPKNLMQGPSGPAFQAKLDPEQYDNPRGYPGLALIQTGDGKPKLPFSSKHDIAHQMEGGAKLAGTGRPGK
jgi:hypothetical protein